MKKQPGDLIYRNYSSPRRKNKKSLNSSKLRIQQIPLRRVLTVALLIALIFSVPVYAHFHEDKKSLSKTIAPNQTKVVISKPVSPTTSQTATPIASTPVTDCSGNTSPQLLIVSISERHLWACNSSDLAYQTAVVTGDTNVAADATPIGTYHIYSKQTNLYLTGSDSRGSWNDYVYYWMPFLSNQYGVFGLHDATWRAPTDFGNISPDSDNASHGCVELPLSAAQWIYTWANVGTTIVINS